MYTSERFLARRAFIKGATLCLGYGWASRGSLAGALHATQLSDSDIAAIRLDLLNLANSERTRAGVGRIEPDDLANAVAAQHASDLANAGFLSHWGSDGRKPYHRYGFAGGIHAAAENVSGAENIAVGVKEIADYLVEMHQTMHDETPPADGHRRTILAPQHTHAGFGFARKGRSLRLVELYIAKYVEVSAVQQTAKPKSSFNLTGRLLNSKYTIQQLDVCYEPIPIPLDPGRKLELGSYGLPDDYVTLRPRLPERVSYSDGSRGAIETGGGRFRVPVSMYKDTPGIYTIVLWIRRTQSDKAFPATGICVRAE